MDKYITINDHFSLTVEHDIIVIKKGGKRGRRVQKAFVVTCLSTGERIAWETSFDFDSQKKLAMHYFTRATEVVTAWVDRVNLVPHPFWGLYDIGLLKEIPNKHERVSSSF